MIHWTHLDGTRPRALRLAGAACMLLLATALTATPSLAKHKDRNDHRRDRQHERHRAQRDHDRRHDGHRARRHHDDRRHRDDRFDRRDRDRRFDRRHRDDRFDRRHRHDRFDRRHRHDRFIVPRHIHRGHSHRYRDYYWGRSYYKPHRHQHLVYRFPVYTEVGVYWEYYPYCGGALYLDGIGGRFSYHGRRVHVDIGF